MSVSDSDIVGCLSHGIRAVSEQYSLSQGVGRSDTTHLDETTAYNRKYFAVKEKKNSKAGVGG